MNIENFLFKQAAIKGEKIALKFRWILIVVIFAFILITSLKGNVTEALYAAIPAGVFLAYNVYLYYLIKSGKNFYFLRYFSVSVDILSLTVHIYINSVFFSPIAVSTTASIFIYPVLMFLAVLRYDKKLIIYATFLTLLAFNFNYYLRFDDISVDLIKKVISSDPMGQIYKSGYFLLLGIFFMQIPDLIYQFINKEKIHFPQWHQLLKLQLKISIACKARIFRRRCAFYIAILKTTMNYSIIFCIGHNHKVGNCRFSKRNFT